jgi:hypothetical protein
MAFYEYYEDLEQDGQRGTGEGNDTGDHSRLSRFRNIAFYFIPVLILTVLFAACWMHTRVSTTERRWWDSMI